MCYYTEHFEVFMLVECTTLAPNPLGVIPGTASSWTVSVDHEYSRSRRPSLREIRHKSEKGQVRAEAHDLLIRAECKST